MIRRQKNLLEEIIEGSEASAEVIVRRMSKEKFVQISRNHPELQMEREKNGIVTIMTPIAGGSGYRENSVNFYVTLWQKTKGGGRTYSPSTGFDLPNGSTKSSDASWISEKRLSRVPAAVLERSFIPMAPDFVCEVRSHSDSLKKLQKKMRETWIANGVRLAWLIDPYHQKAYIYRVDGSESVVEGFDKELLGEDVMPGFVLKLEEFRVGY